VADLIPVVCFQECFPVLLSNHSDGEKCDEYNGENFESGRDCTVSEEGVNCNGEIYVVKCDMGKSRLSQKM
jgi:hypothetical protein